jgi:flagellar biosynthesis protein FliQ
MSEVQAAKATSKCSCTTELTLKIMTAVNCVFAVIVCGLGIYKYSAGSIENFSQAFVPFYLIVFGVLLICAEMEWVFVVKYFKFLDNLMGR